MKVEINYRQKHTGKGNTKVQQKCLVDV